MATITLKNVPDELYRRLKEEAARNRRSLNQEVITRLATGAPSPSRDSVEQKLERLRKFRAALPAAVDEVTLDDVDRWKRAGRA